MTTIPNIILSNGIKMPQLGFGTFKVEEGTQTSESVKTALELGYRHIDTAAIYKNETGVGEGIRLSGVNRSDIFLVSKVWNTDQGYESTLAAFDASLERLKTDYLDLYLIHWPKPLNAETWRALELLYTQGRVKSIGVSNFKEHHLDALLETAKIIPMVNQIELHPQLPQKEVRAYCAARNIAISAWGPLMQGAVFAVPLLQQLAEKYGKSISQVTLRWHIQQGIIVIPKSINASRIAENAGIFDFELSADDMTLMESLNTGVRVGSDPDKITF